jgi:anti-sigma regulatory factor (Ser/Thr protein kinase)
MIEELDMHLLDLVQNAYAAGSTKVDIQVLCDDAADRLVLSVSDDGRGMDEDTLAVVRRGYYSSKSPQGVGLGIPLLRETAEHCNGRFSITSSPGHGTAVVAEFQRSHVDLPPFGDLPSTFLSILVTAGARCVSITYRCNHRELELDTEALSELLGDLPLQHPEVIRFLEAYIAERVI